MMRSAGAVGGAVVLLASGASVAVAAPATFSATPFATVGTSNPITMSWGPNAPTYAAPWRTRTCTVSGGGGTSVSNSGGQGSLTGLTILTSGLWCTDGYGAKFSTTITLSGSALANVNAGSYSLSSTAGLRINDTANTPGLHAVSSPAPFTAPYTNGTTATTGANPSKWTFSNTLVGYVTDSSYGPDGVVHPLYLTGSFTFGRPAPLTLF